MHQKDGEDVVTYRGAFEWLLCSNGANYVLRAALHCRDRPYGNSFNIEQVPTIRDNEQE